MAYDLYIAVGQGAGTITCSVGTQRTWSTSSYSPTGYSDFSYTTATFTATPSSGYEFSGFVVYKDGSWYAAYTNNPSNLSFGQDGSYTVYVYFNESSTYTCNIYRYLNGSYYDSLSYEVEQNSYLSTSDISAPSGASFSSATINGTAYSYLPSSLYISSDTTVYIYYVSTYTVYLRTYKDGSLYTSNSYSIPSGSYINPSDYTSAPSGYHLDYVSAGGTTYASLNVNIRITSTTYVYVYYVADKVRPLDWSWTTTVAQGSEIKLTAAEWNNFTSRINEFREYADLSSYTFTKAVSGVTVIEATICNEAYTAIDAITGHGTLPTKLVSGGSLYASFFNGLKNALNAIP